ncbi:MAG TPA: hypothetical protein DCO75_03950 [Fibrobacteres bacterium]|nr:hypothetical protein [Fibrobacterota bacterium]
MLFSVLGVLGVITGYNIYGHLRGLNEKINQRITKEFEKPNISKTIELVAKDNAAQILINNIEPEVVEFRLTIDSLISNTDSIIKSTALQFSNNLEEKSNVIEEKLVVINNSLNEIEKSRKEILSIETEMNNIKKLAEPPKLKQKGFNKESIDNGLRLTVNFEPTKNEPLGVITFIVTILDDAKLLKIGTNAKYGAFTGGEQGNISNNKIGQYQYSLVGSGDPTVVIEVSKQCDFIIESNYLEKPVNFNKSKY